MKKRTGARVTQVIVIQPGWARVSVSGEEPIWVPQTPQLFSIDDVKASLHLEDSGSDVSMLTLTGDDELVVSTDKATGEFESLMVRELHDEFKKLKDEDLERKVEASEDRD